MRRSSYPEHLTVYPLIGKTSIQDLLNERVVNTSEPFLIGSPETAFSITPAQGFAAHRGDRNH
jgi:hypothetical protein